MTCFRSSCRRISQDLEFERLAREDVFIPSVYTLHGSIPSSHLDLPWLTTPSGPVVAVSSMEYLSNPCQVGAIDLAWKSHFTAANNNTSSSSSLQKLPRSCDEAFDSPEAPLIHPSSIFVSTQSSPCSEDDDTAMGLLVCVPVRWSAKAQVTGGFGPHAFVGSEAQLSRAEAKLNRHCCDMESEFRKISSSYRPLRLSSSDYTSSSSVRGQ